jgi:hypothetical protein
MMFLFGVPNTAAKNKLRDSLRNLSAMLIQTRVNIRSVMVNVSTTDTGNENLLRPNADKRYWLKPEKIVQLTLPTLLGNSASSYEELDVFEPQPGFDADTYYRNAETLLKKWRKEMGTDTNS